MAVYAFDFDGVLFDTARECLAVAFATAKATPGAARERWGNDPAPPPEVAAAFLQNRGWVGPPWQYGLLLDCIAADRLPATMAEFLDLAKARAPEFATFTARYFAMRGELSRDVAGWCANMRPYDLALAAFRELHEAGKAVVLSTRDDASIRLIFRHFAGISPEILPNGGGGREKWTVLIEAAQRRGLAPQQVFFLDDYLEHALPAQRHGIAAHLALWGYTDARASGEARAAGLPCVALPELEHVLAHFEAETVK
ncbi:MAG TPA: HAD family hydrolase [Solimonas sp.]|nr:HAD family hydrolase [Solimonas sp.]